MRHGGDVCRGGVPSLGRYDRPIADHVPARTVLARLILPLYLPALLVTTGIGMLIPVLPLYLREIGLSYTLVTAVLGAAGIGALLAQIPAGSAISRFGDRAVMAGAIILIGVAVALLGVTTITLALVGLRVIAGIGSTGWLLSRHSLMTTAVGPEVRGRVSSTFGGVNRFAFLIGPLLGGTIASRWGFEPAFAATGAVTALGLVPLLVEQSRERRSVDDPPGDSPETVWTVLRTHARALATVGFVQFAVIAVREGRQAVVPLLGSAMGLDVASVGLLVGVGAASDLLLFPIAGFLMDRFGRTAAIVPSLSLIAVGLFAAAAATSTTPLIVGVAVIGLGNGLGAGTMLTIGSDLAPQSQPGRFLSIVGTVRESGRVIGPILVGRLADTVGLGWGAAALGGLAVVTAVFAAKVMGDTRRLAS